MSDIVKKLDELNATFQQSVGDVSTRVGEMEKRFARLPDDYTGSASDSVSMAHRLVNSPDFKSLNGGRARGRAAVEMAAITTASSTVGTGRSAATSLVSSDRLPGIVTPAERVLTVRDLIASGRTGAGSIEFVQETGFTNNAAPVAEGALKPYSDLEFDLKTSPVRTIAHLFKISKQMIDDAEGIVSYLDVRGKAGLKIREENQLLFGDGIGQNIHGLVPQATVFDDGLRKPSDTAIDTIRHAILQVRRAEYRATGIVMHPDDVAELELTKDGEGRYVFVTNLADGGGDRIWRLPIVDSTAMPVGTFLVGAFEVAAQVFDRQQVVFELSTENEDDFARNLATARVEERLALAVYRPESFVHGEFAAPAP